MNKQWWEGNAEFSQRDRELVKWAMRNTFLRFMEKKFSSWIWNLSILPDSGDMRLALTYSLDRAESLRLLSVIYFFFLSQIDQKKVFQYKDIYFEYSLSKEVFRDMFGGWVRNLIDSGTHLSVFPRIWPHQTTIEDYQNWLRDIIDIDITQQVIDATGTSTMELLWI